MFSAACPAAPLLSRLPQGARAPYLAPSLLAACPLQLGLEVQAVAQAGADWLHLDVMDGHFVPNLSFGPHVAQAIHQAGMLAVDAHLMVQAPEALALAYARAGVAHLTFHVEAVRDVVGLICRLREAGVGVGLSLHPATRVQRLLPYLRHVDLVLVMSVRPGFGGQRFMPQALARVRTLVEARAAMQLSFVIEVDGGIDATTAGGVVAAGADALVAGSAVFDPAAAQLPLAARTAHYAQRLAALRAGARQAQTAKG